MQTKDSINKQICLNTNKSNTGTNKAQRNYIEIALHPINIISQSVLYIIKNVIT